MATIPFFGHRRSSFPQVCFILLFLFHILAACQPRADAPEPAPAGDSRPFRVGIAGFTPRRFPDSTEEDFASFLQELPALGELFGVYAAWDDPFLENQIDFALQAQGIQPLVATGFNYDAVALGYFEENHDAIIERLLFLAGEYDLEYLGFGGEVNRLAPEKGEAVYQEFIDLYADVYDALKSEYPVLKVFTVFQYEFMNGSARLSGLELSPQWDSLAGFGGRLDAAAFTVYPFLEHESVSAIPEEYLGTISQYIDGPVIISETGWPSQNVEVDGQVLVQGSQEAQAEYIDWIEVNAEQIDADVLMHAIMHDFESGIALFDHIGLKQNDGTPKAAYHQWQELAARPFESAHE